jgi:opacity protein-like surface antigen
MRLCSVLMAAGLSAGFIASASAADLEPVYTKTPPPPVPDWAGFYVGVHGGYGWGQTSFNPTFQSNTAQLANGVFIFAPPGVDPKGGVFGGQAGYNWQWGPVVGGLEIDFSGADINQTSPFSGPTAPVSFAAFSFTQQVKIEDLASARARLGYLIVPNLLVYGTAGAAWAHSEYDVTQVRNSTSPASLTGSVISSSSFDDEFGWVAGAGLEWKLWDHWLLRGEYLHYDFGRTTDAAVPSFTFQNGSPPVGIFVNPRNTIDVARAGLSYKF